MVRAENETAYYCCFHDSGRVLTRHEAIKTSDNTFDVCVGCGNLVSFDLVLRTPPVLPETSPNCSCTTATGTHECLNFLNFFPDTCQALTCTRTGMIKYIHSAIAFSPLFYSVGNHYRRSIVICKSLKNKTQSTKHSKFYSKEK